MNPLVRWVKKIIQFFRPAPAPAPVTEPKPVAPVAAVSVPEKIVEKATVIETKVFGSTAPEIIPSKPAEVLVKPVKEVASLEPAKPAALAAGGTDPSTPLRSAQDDNAVKKEMPSTVSVPAPGVGKETEAAPVTSPQSSEVAAAVPGDGLSAAHVKEELPRKVSEPEPVEPSPALAKRVDVPVKAEEEVNSPNPVVLEPAKSVVTVSGTDPSTPLRSAQDDNAVKKEVPPTVSVPATVVEKKPEAPPLSSAKVSEVATAIPARSAEAIPATHGNEPGGQSSAGVQPSVASAQDEELRRKVSSLNQKNAKVLSPESKFSTPVEIRTEEMKPALFVVPAPRTDPSSPLRSAQNDQAVKEAVLPASSAPAPSTGKETVEEKPVTLPTPAPSIPTPPQPVPATPPAIKAEEKKPGQPVFTGRVEHTPDLDKPARLRQNKGMLSVHDIANRELLDLVPYEPGKPVDDVARELGLDPASIIKLASNENPLGPSPLAMAAMRDAVEKVHFYPDGGGFHLRNAIAKSFGLGRENVVLGNGSNEIIELLFHTFTRPGIHEIVTARHAFAVYTLMAQLFGVHAIVVDDVDFTPDLNAMLRAVTPQTRLIFLASPNNPTGTRVTNEALEAFLRDLPPHVIAVLDEAYYEFLDNPPDTVGQVRAGAQVVLMRTFSKIQGLAGLRIGYGLAALEIADLLQRARQPFNANSIAQAGAMAGLADIEHQRKTKAITDEGRKLIEEAFARMGLKYVPSSANFILVHVGDGGEVFKRLMKKGIIVRSMVSYHLPEYIRVSIGTPEQNARFLAELPGALEGLIKINQA